jgi:hypothetical protein
MAEASAGEFGEESDGENGIVEIRGNIDANRSDA